MEKIESYNNDEAFFSIVNNNNIQRKVDEATLSKLKHLYPFIERGVEASIRNDEYEIEYERQVERDKKANKKFLISIVAAACILVSSISIAGRAIIDHLKINVADQIVVETLEKKLLHNGCADLYFTSNGGSKEYKFVVNDNSVDDYSRISTNDLKDIYCMRSILSDEEFKDFIKSRTFVDSETGSVMHYENFTHFLYVNGFRNEAEFNRASKDMLLDNYNTDNVRININNTDVGYVYVETGRGGK